MEGWMSDLGNERKTKRKERELIADLGVLCAFK